MEAVREASFCSAETILRESVFFTQPQTLLGEWCVGKMPRAKSRPKARGEREEKGILGAVSREVDFLVEI